MIWSNKEHQVYSERTDLTAETFQDLVRLTLARRLVVTARNARELWDGDQLVLAELIRCSG